MDRNTVSCFFDSQCIYMLWMIQNLSPCNVYLKPTTNTSILVYLVWPYFKTQSSTANVYSSNVISFRCRLDTDGTHRRILCMDQFNVPYNKTAVLISFNSLTEHHFFRWRSTVSKAMWQKGCIATTNLVLHRPSPYFTMHRHMSPTKASILRGTWSLDLSSKTWFCVSISVSLPHKLAHNQFSRSCTVHACARETTILWHNKTATGYTV